MNRHEIALDLDKTATRRNFAPVVLRQNDLHGCEISATITDHGKPIEQDGLSAYLALKLPSGAYYRASAEWDGTVALVVIDEHFAASELGKTVPAYFELRHDDDIIATTQDFPMRSIASATDGEPAESYDSLIEQEIEKANIAVDTANDTIALLEDAIEDLNEHVIVLTNEQIDAMFQQ